MSQQYHFIIRFSPFICMLMIFMMTGPLTHAQRTQDQARLSELQQEYSPQMPETLPTPATPGDPTAVYLQYGSSPTTELIIGWITGKNTTNNAIMYRQFGTENWSTLQASQAPLHGTTEYTIHHVTLSQLIPGTYYQWRFQTNGEIFSARTMPETANRIIRFAQGADVFSWYGLAGQMNQVVAEQNPDFVVICGDIIEHNNQPETYKKWIHFLNLWQNTMRSPEDDRLIPIIPVMGEKERIIPGSKSTSEDAPFFSSIFSINTEQSYRVIDFGNYLSLIMLDSNHTSDIDGKQRDFLEKTLKTRNDGRMLVAAHHLPMYPAVNNPLNTESTELRNAWGPLYDIYGLDLSLHGHEHTYARTWPLSNGKVHPDGVIYVGSGGWGLIENQTPKQPGHLMLMDEYWYLAKASQQNYGLIIELDQKQVRMRALNRHAEVFDELEFTLNQPSNDVPAGRSRMPEFEVIGILILALIAITIAFIARQVRQSHIKRINHSPGNK